MKLLAPPASSPAPAITRQLSHCIGSTRWFIPQQITKHIFVHKCSKLVKLVATPQLANLRAFVEASYASPSSRHESSLLSSLPHVAHVLHSSAMRRACCKTGLRQYLSTYSCKNCTVRRNLLVVLDQSERPNWPSVNKF